MIVCDHAGREIPQDLGRLGLLDAEFERHIAWDIGAAAVAKGLGDALDAPVIRQRYSRLVIDCNRAPGRADAIVRVSDGTVVPGNAGVDAAEAARREALIHRPYHDAIAAELDARAAWGQATALVLVHSFTPVMAGFARPWLTGVLHTGVSPLSRAMLARLGAEPGMVVGDNEPYAMDDIDYTAPHHAIGRGLDYVELEIRQDLIADPAGQAWAVALLARLLPEALTLSRRKPG